MGAASKCALAPYSLISWKALVIFMVAPAWVSGGVDGCAVSRLLGSGQASELHTVGLFFEWFSPGNALQLGSPGSGNSGWRLLDPSPLCPLLSTALVGTPPECAKPVESGVTRQTKGKTNCGALGPDERCAWEEDRPGWPFLAVSVPPLRSAIVLPAPLDPVLQSALSARRIIRSSRLREEASDGETKPSHIGLWFHRAVQPTDIPYEGSADEGRSGAVPRKWTVGGLTRHLQGSGAHRRLLTRVLLQSRGDLNGGQPVRLVALVEALSPGVYADKFEVQRLAADGAASAASMFGPVDIERPAPECTQSLAVAYARPVELPGGGYEASFVLPLHSRYPAVAPTHGNGSESPSPRFTACEIGPPLYVLWTESPGLSTEEDLRMHTEWQRATWQGMSDEDTVVRWLVPNGIPEHAGLVQIGTVSVCLAGIVYLLSIVAIRWR